MCSNRRKRTGFGVLFLRTVQPMIGYIVVFSLSTVHFFKCTVRAEGECRVSLLRRICSRKFGWNVSVFGQKGRKIHQDKISQQHRAKNTCLWVGWNVTWDILTFVAGPKWSVDWKILILIEERCNVALWRFSSIWLLNVCFWGVDVHF